MAGNGVRLAVGVVLADTGADHHGADEGQHASGKVNDRGTCEVDVTVAEPEVRSELGKPAAAPHPVAVDRIDDGPDENSVDAEGREFPALGHGSGRYGRRGIHEYHLKQEHADGADVVGSVQEEALRADEAEGFPEQVHRQFLVQAVEPSQGPHGPESAEHDRVSADVEAQHAQGIDQEIHGHGMSRVLGAGQPRFHHRETGLHEHDEEPRNEQPNHVDGNPVLAYRRRKIGHRRGRGKPGIGGGTRRRSRRIFRSDLHGIRKGRGRSRDEHGEDKHRRHFQ